MPLYEARLSSQFGRNLNAADAAEALQNVFNGTKDCVRGFYHGDHALIVTSDAESSGQLLRRYPGILHSVKDAPRTSFD